MKREGTMPFALRNEAGTLGVQCNHNGLSLAGVPLLAKRRDGFDSRPVEELRHLLSRAYRTKGEWSDEFERIVAVAAALNDGNPKRALNEAAELRLPDLDWDGAVRIAYAENALAKCGFDPNEPRDRCGRWTAGGAEALAPIILAGLHSHSVDFDYGNIDDAAYNGDYHNWLLKDLERDFRRRGCNVLREINVIGINRVVGRVDIIVQPPNGGLPMVLEIKTGLKPQYTDSQRVTYLLLAVGGHATSDDPRVSSVGLTPG
jgi:hypothetical protein